MTKKTKAPQAPSAADKAQSALVAGIDAPAQPKSRNTVFVACNMPHGLTLRAFRNIEVPRAEQGRVILEKVAQQIGEAFTVKGNAAAFGQPFRAPIVGGFAITTGCPEDLWKSWFRDNENSDMVKNGLIFADEKRERVEARARENKKQRSGLERIDVSAGSKDPRLLKGIKKFDPDAMGQDEEAAA